MHSILLVEDDRTIRDATALSLERDGFRVETAGDGAAGLAAFRARRPDLALLDVMLPAMDGVSLCRAIRAESSVAVVMLSARSDPVDVVLGLEAGADDYVAKPFDPPVLAARLRAVLRRATPASGRPVLRFGDLEIDTGGMVVRVGGSVISLSPIEYRLLLELARNTGIVLTRDTLLENVWDYSWAGDTRLVDVAVQRLRAKIGARPHRDRARGGVQAGPVRHLRSLRWRLALAFALVATLVTAALGVSVYQASKSDRLDRARSVVLGAPAWQARCTRRPGASRSAPSPPGHPCLPRCAPWSTAARVASYATTGPCGLACAFRGRAYALHRRSPTCPTSARWRGSAISWW